MSASLHGAVKLDGLPLIAHTRSRFVGEPLLRSSRRKRVPISVPRYCTLCDYHHFLDLRSKRGGVHARLWASYALHWLHAICCCVSEHCCFLRLACFRALAIPFVSLRSCDTQLPVTRRPAPSFVPRCRLRVGSISHHRLRRRGLVSAALVWQWQQQCLSPPANHSCAGRRDLLKLGWPCVMTLANATLSRGYSGA